MKIYLLSFFLASTALGDSSNASRKFPVDESNKVSPISLKSTWVSDDSQRHLNPIEFTTMMSDLSPEKENVFGFQMPKNDGPVQFSKTIRVRESFGGWTNRLQKFGWNVGVVARGTHSQRPNQDSFLVHFFYGREANETTPSWKVSESLEPQFALLALFDGHGSRGQDVSNTAVRVTLSHFEEQKENKKLPVGEETSREDRNEAAKAMLRSLLDEFNSKFEQDMMRQIQDVPKEVRPKLLEAGSTAVWLLYDIKEEMMYYGNAGDSPILAKFKSEDAPRRLTIEHQASVQSERKRASDDLKKLGFRPVQKKLVSSPEQGHSQISILYAKEDQSTLMTFDMFQKQFRGKKHPQFDFRVGGFQPTRGIGMHFSSKQEVAYKIMQPPVEIEEIDLKENPLDYLILMSDGVTGALEGFYWDLHMHKLSSKREAARKRNMPSAPLPDELFLKFGNENSEFSDEYDEALEKVQKAVETMANERIHKTIIDNIGGGTKKILDLLFENSRQPSSVLSEKPGYYDDVTIIAWFSQDFMPIATEVCVPEEEVPQVVEKPAEEVKVVEPEGPKKKLIGEDDDDVVQLPSMFKWLESVVS
eukprot:GHVP01068509.1.p1 GENE.GHVP01068509.1~~GHVP01068509.1.p1  ORF type:complete len:588 (-),score=139.44 GHVP01068509.1:31-1794(-)